MPDWEDLLKDIDVSLEGKTDAPQIETIPKPKLAPSRKVIVQKIISEIWIYTDMEGKTFGHQGIQDVVVVGEMEHADALKMIAEKKTRKRRNT